MSFGHHELIAALIQQEERDPGNLITGSRLLHEFSPLVGDDSSRAWEVLARAAAKLRKLAWIDWQYQLWPGERTEPAEWGFDSQRLQQVSEIVVTTTGLQAHAARQSAQVATTQINIIHSTVGQLALGDIGNVTFPMLLDALDVAIAGVDATAEAKTEARGALRKMREVAASVAGSTAQGLLDAAVRKSIGL